MAKVVPIEEGRKNKPDVYRFKVLLDESQPEIWRRFEVESNISLYALHNVIQIVMNWTNAHLHIFDVNGTRYAMPEYFEDVEEAFLDEQDVKLSELGLAEGSVMKYEYDMGDNWGHTLTLEQISKPDPKKSYPLCIEGAMACPLEDCGGLHGYYNMLKIMSDPDNPEYEDTVDWLGDDFEAEFFDIEDVNLFLEEVRDITDYDLYEYYDNFEEDLDKDF